MCKVKLPVLTSGCDCCVFRHLKVGLVWLLDGRVSLVVGRVSLVVGW